MEVTDFLKLMENNGCRLTIEPSDELIREMRGRGIGMLEFVTLFAQSLPSLMDNYVKRMREQGMRFPQPFGVYGNTSFFLANKQVEGNYSRSQNDKLHFRISPAVDSRLLEHPFFENARYSDYMQKLHDASTILQMDVDDAFDIVLTRPQIRRIRNAGINTLMDINHSNIRCVKGIGRSSLKRIIKRLEEYGIDIKKQVVKGNKE